MDGSGSASMCLMGVTGAEYNGNVPGGIGVISHPDWDAACNGIPNGDKSAYGQQRIIMQDAIAVIPN